MIGQTIAHFVVIEKLGEGGMGVVYKVRDQHLDRFVALKVLQPAVVADPERRRRFVLEAKAASALNHPNIIHIYDFGESDGVAYLAMEYVDGPTFSKLIEQKTLNLERALRLAVQIADALIAAHGAGIAHRDLKPSNLILSQIGVVKVLDFGLAKLVGPRGDSGALAQSGTLEGAVVGTAAYMSPEQARGTKLDARSDIFSFGAVLYEMISGQRSVSGSSGAEIMAALLRDNPRPLSQAAPGVPKEVERIVHRCLEKDAGRRFQAMSEVKQAMEAFQSSTASGIMIPARRARLRPWLAAGLAVVLVLAVVAGWWISRRSPSRTALLTPVPLTGDQGTELNPSISPDGKIIAYSWDGPNRDNYDIYTRPVGAAQSLRLTTDPRTDGFPAWSPDGKTIAFVRVSDPDSAVYLVPSQGGPERKIAGGAYAGKIAWSPDGRFLIMTARRSEDDPASLTLISVNNGARGRLLTPPDVVTVDRDPALSPDGSKLLFTRCRGFFRCGLYVSRLTPDYQAGDPVLLSDERSDIQGSAWTPDGRDAVYAISEGAVTNYHLERIRAQPGAQPERLVFASERSSWPAIAVRGHILTYSQNLNDMDVRQIEPGQAPRSFASSTRQDYNPQFSPDGRHVAISSDRSGLMAVWICDRDGQHVTQLTHFDSGPSGTPRWSPDGRSIAFDHQLPSGWRVFVIPADGGEPRRLTSAKTEESIPSWSRDGKWIYYTSTASGASEVWKAPSAGGSGIQVTRHGGQVAFESPDGRSLYYTKTAPVSAVWMAPVEGGAEQQIVPVTVWRNFAVEADGIYYIPPPEKSGGTALRFFRFATGQSEVIAPIEERLSVGLTVSPDRQTILYSGFTRYSTNLMVAENFR
jgi:serine/threonine protein kinase